MPVPQTGGECPMESNYIMGCPECSMAFGMQSPIHKVGEHFQCRADPLHKFKIGEDGFLKSI